MNKPGGRCAYSSDLVSCQDQPINGSLYCFWHAPEADKTGADVKERLEERARTGEPMDGFILKGSYLENLNLVNIHGEPYHLTNADLSRANLHNAHLYKVDLSGSRLLKANLSGANLHCADLSGCNLLGVNLKACRLEHVNWGAQICQALMAKGIRGLRRQEKAVALYEEAEEVARNIRKNCEGQGLFDVAGEFFHREMIFRRYQMPRFSYRRIMSKLVDLVSGYGEKPIRVIFFSAIFILVCSVFYFVNGINDSGEVVRFAWEQTYFTNFKAWLDCLYFSVVTFTTLGYGDLTPLGPSRICAALEAFTGSFSLALFVVVFVKKMTR
ncbi:pentapeptide repeat-containing protein [Endozoicomonas sp. Mp262]|uniref:pentapeptide repeat-containing protein n=1 Tax=Endozoicomonas sp. Mp262 TaxID=2919499 RepID=UPI0021DF5989